MVDKITKEELKQPDKLQVLFGDVMKTITQHRKEMVIAVVAVICIGLAATGWYFYRQNEERNASTLYNKASEEYNASRASGKDPAAVIKLFTEVDAKYSGTQAAAFAAYRLGNLNLNRGNTDEAIKWYRKYLNDRSEDNELRLLVLNGLGYCYEAKKDYKNALIYFEKSAAGKAGVNFASMTYDNIGRIYEAMNDPKKALENYKKALEKAADPGTKELLNRKIASLG